MTCITGIDLGTTNSAAAILNEIGKPEIVPNAADGGRLTPSAILFNDDGTGLTVGDDAKGKRGMFLPGEAARYLEEIKREMHNLGFRHSSPDAGEYSPADLSAAILKKTVSGIAEHHGGIGPVVISVPAYFQEAGRKATMEAGHLAGLDVVALINEPTAAALSYANGRNLDGRYLVFDLGGGTFDVTIIEAHGNDINVLTSQGDPHLGGGDFDRALLAILEQEYHDKTGEKLLAGEDGSESREQRYKFLEVAEKTKHALSKKDKHAVLLLNDYVGERVKVEVSREQLNESISAYLGKAEMLTELALDKANLSHGDIAEILMVGGSTRIPAVRELVTSHFGKEPVTAVNPDECVALGAAIQAGITSGNSRSQIALTDVVNHSYGTLVHDDDTGGYENSLLIKKDAPLPAEGEGTFYTLVKGQRVVRCTVTQGEGEDADFVNTLGEIELPLPADRPANQKIRVFYVCDENHILHCHYEDVESGNSREIRLDLKGEHDDADIEQRKRQLDKLTIE